MIAYITRRLVLALVTIWAISVISYAIIQLPPGDFVDSYIANLSASGSMVSAQEAEAMREQYGLDRPIWVQYWKWISRVVRGDFGVSMEWNRPVTEVIGDRHLAHHRDLDRGDHPDLGDRLADRHLLGRAAVLVRRLHLHLRRLRRPRRAELPARADRHVPRLPLFRRRASAGCSRRDTLARLVLGQGLGPDAAPAAAGADPGARRHRAADPHHARQPARRAAPALRRRPPAPAACRNGA